MMRSSDRGARSTNAKVIEYLHSMGQNFSNNDNKNETSELQVQQIVKPQEQVQIQNTEKPNKFFSKFEDDLIKYE